jgi:hypothetical protein
MWGQIKGKVPLEMSPVNESLNTCAREPRQFQIERNGLLTCAL